MAIPKPIICAINGAAVGIGLVLPLFCDFRYAAASAKLSVMFSRRGLVAEHGITWMLPRMIGLPRALELMIAGQTIKATPQVIWEPGVTATFQWKLDGNDIPNATSLTHRALTSEIGHELTITATLTKANVSATTQSVRRTVLGQLLKLTPTPKITGQAVSGKTLKVSAGKWDAGTTLTYQWLSDGTEVPGETASTYQLTTDDVGHIITVAVTGTKNNYAEASKTSKATSRVR